MTGGKPVIIITNQSGVARGCYWEEDVVKFNKALEIRGAHIDKIYYFTLGLENESNYVVENCMER